MNAEYKMPIAECPRCFYQCDTTTVMEGTGTPPKPGDISVCFNCGNITTFDERLQLTDVSDDLLEELKKDEVGWRTAQRAIAYIKNRGPINRENPPTDRLR